MNLYNHLNSFPEHSEIEAFIEISVDEVTNLLEEEDYPFKNADEVAHVVIKRMNRVGRW